MADEWEAMLRDLSPERARVMRDTRARLVSELAVWAEREVIGQPLEPIQLQGVTLWRHRAEVRLDDRLEALQRELPITYTRSYPMANLLRVRPRLLRLHRRARTRRWARRRGLLEEYVGIQVEMRYGPPLKMVWNTVRIA